MRSQSFLLILVCLTATLACRSDKKSEAGSVVAILPSTPTQVAQEWVEAFYNDNFEKAVRLGTENTRMMIDSVKLELIPGAQNIAFRITNMTCETQGDSSFCAYIYEEDREEFQEFVQLLLVNGQWLVDESWEEPSPEELEMEELIREELEKIFEESESK
jgi:hypothetical protein